MFTEDKKAFTLTYNAIEVRGGSRGTANSD